MTPRFYAPFPARAVAVATLAAALAACTQSPTPPAAVAPAPVATPAPVTAEQMPPPPVAGRDVGPLEVGFMPDVAPFNPYAEMPPEADVNAASGTAPGPATPDAANGPTS